MIAGREKQLAAIAPPNGDGVLRILYQQPGAADPNTRDLYMLPVDAAGEPGTETLLATGLDPTSDLGCIHRLAPCSIDPSGWTMLYGKNGYVRVNTVTGERMDLGSSLDFPFTSASGQRTFMTDRTAVTSGSTGTLSEPDGSTTTIDYAAFDGWGSTYTFFGEDFYYLTPAKDLMHIPPSGAPEKLATGVDGFNYWSTSGGIVMLLNRQTSDPMVADSSVLDLSTGQETALPFDATPGTMGGGGNSNVSPAGGWIVHIDSDANAFDFFDYRSGTLQVVPSPVPVGSFPGSYWHPGTSELWVQLGYDTPAIWIIKPDAPPLLVGNLRFSGGYSPRTGMGSSFTADGQYWFSTESDYSVMYPVIQIGVADDPTGPRHLAAPTGMNFDRYWPLGDGRLLTTVFTKDLDRADLMAFDPRTGEDRLLGEKGRVAEVGKTRVLGLLHFQGGASDLTAIDVSSGQQTVLAPEFAVTAFAEPQGDDLVAPGTRAVYEFEARSPSPYDGVWVVNVP